MGLMLGLAVLALLWDNVMRIPALQQALNDAVMERDSLRLELEEKIKRVEELEDENLALDDQLSRIHDPEHYSALDAGDGEALYDLDKRRGNI